MDDAKSVEWFYIDKLPKNIAFDHLTIINEGLKIIAESKKINQYKSKIM